MPSEFREGEAMSLRPAAPTAERELARGPTSAFRRAAVVAVLVALLLGAGGLVELSKTSAAHPATVPAGRAIAPSLGHPTALDRGRSPATSPTLTWWNVTNESNQTAPTFWFTEGTWDAADGYLLVYGGDNFAGTNLASTLAYSGGSWWKVNASGAAPGPLDGPSLAYDPSAKSVVMYGGVASYSPFRYTNLTYLYAGGVWSSAHHTPSPPARLSGAMVYDADLGGVVLFGGYNDSDPTGATVLNDLWLFKNGNWSALPDVNPPAKRTWATVGYDPSRHELVLYGGATPSLTCYGDTWTYNGTWHRFGVIAGGPPALIANEIGYDPDLGGVIVSGGQLCSGGINNRTWLFNGTGWQSVSVGGNASEHYYGVGAWDPVDRLFVLAGGNPAATFTDVLSTPLQIANVTAPTSGEAGQNLSFNASAAGGTPGRNATWSWGDGTPTSAGWTTYHTFPRSGTFAVNLSVTDRAGGSASWTGYVTVSRGVSPAIVLSDPTLDLGVNGTFVASSSGGAEPVAFNWTFGDGGSASGANVEHAYLAVGNFTVRLTATDAIGSVGTTSATVGVVRHVAVNVVGGTHGESGASTEYRAVPSGGVAPLSYAWTVDGVGAGVDPTLSFRFGTTGHHAVGVTVTDATNASAEFHVDTIVSAAPSLTVQGPGTVTAGDPGTWTAVVGGGVGPYVFAWSFSDGGSGTGATAVHTLVSSGAYALHFRVVDALNGSANATLNVTASGVGGTTSSNVGGVPLVAVVGALVAVIAVAAVLGVWMMRRRPGRG